MISDGSVSVMFPTGGRTTCRRRTGRPDEGAGTVCTYRRDYNHSVYSERYTQPRFSKQKQKWSPVSYPAQNAHRHGRSHRPFSYSETCGLDVLTGHNSQSFTTTMINWNTISTENTVNHDRSNWTPTYLCTERERRAKRLPHVTSYDAMVKKSAFSTRSRKRSRFLLNLRPYVLQNNF